MDEAGYDLVVRLASPLAMVLGYVCMMCSVSYNPIAYADGPNNSLSPSVVLEWVCSLKAVESTSARLYVTEVAAAIVTAKAGRGVAVFVIRGAGYAEVTAELDVSDQVLVRHRPSMRPAGNIPAILSPFGFAVANRRTIDTEGLATYLRLIMPSGDRCKLFMPFDVAVIVDAVESEDRLVVSDRSGLL